MTTTSRPSPSPPLPPSRPGSCAKPRLTSTSPPPTRRRSRAERGTDVATLSEPPEFRKVVSRSLVHCEGSEVVGEEPGLLHGGEVAASLELGPVGHVVLRLDP